MTYVWRNVVGVTRKITDQLHHNSASGVIDSPKSPYIR